MTNNNQNGVAFLGLLIMSAVVIGLYFLSHILFVVGIFAIITGIVLGIIGFSSDNPSLGTIGVFIILGGFVSTSIGGIGLDFFNHNPTGQALLDTSNTVVDTTKESFVQVSEVQGELHEAFMEVSNELGEVN